jgi:short-subunit dehydrogenase
MMKRIVIIGAASAMAKECARLWAIEGVANFDLVVRNDEHLKTFVKDLLVRNPNLKINVHTADFTNESHISKLVDQLSSNGPIDIVLIAHGTPPDQINCESSLPLCNRTLQINGVSPCLFAEAFAGVMQKQSRGNIAIIGSVAGDRGRKSNYIYGAAKGLVSRYAQGMQHRFAGTGIVVSLIKPGPTATPMTEKLRGNGMKFAPVALVAKEIVDGIAKGKSVIYTPKKWQIIMLIIQHLPSFVFNKLNI